MANHKHVHMPEQVPLPMNTIYCIPDLSEKNGRKVLTWTGSEEDHRNLSRNLVYRNANHATAAQAAMLQAMSRKVEAAMKA